MSSVTLDRVEGNWAVLLWGEEEVVVPAQWLPQDAGEGAQLTLELRVDGAGTAARRGDLAERIQRLAADDDGEDIAL